MSTVVYMCPCCGAPLSYSGTSGKLECASCGNGYEPEVLEAMKPSEASDEVRFDLPGNTFDAEDAEAMQGYTCKSCGAELMTEGTTTATECPYCGSPTILPERIEGGVKPEKVIPFTVSKEQAQKQFEEYFKGKRLLPNVFTESRNRIAEMRKLYVPYWLFDCNAVGDIIYNAEKRHRERRGEWEIEHVRHYTVRRAGAMGFEDIPVDGSQKLDNRITESLEPYDFSAAVDFQPGVLAGAMADHADVDAAACEGRAIDRVRNSMSDALRSTVSGYSSVIERSRNIHAEGGKITPVLMPVWLITTEKEGTVYTFAINGQTGKLTCDVPADRKKAALWGVGVFAGVFAAIAAMLYFAGQMADGTLLFAAIGALIAALLVVSVLKGQLKQAVHQHSAHNYVRDGSFRLMHRSDHFLYETTNRRRIETNHKP